MLSNIYEFFCSERERREKDTVVEEGRAVGWPDIPDGLVHFLFQCNGERATAWRTLCENDRRAWEQHSLAPSALPAQTCTCCDKLST
jgi:hypothetical protein